jgi:hypothetical protein
MHRRHVLARAAALLGWVVGVVATGPAAAQGSDKVDLLLALAVDTSGSVDQTRFELQRDGYAAAFRSRQVLAAIQSGGNQAIAVTMFQWTGPELQVQVLPWTLIRDAGNAEDFAAAIERAPRQLFSGGTSISGAIDYGARLFPQSRWTGLRRVIDVSGDGPNNRGRPAADARDDALRAGIVINGLPILALEPRLDSYYWNNVIGGSGAFMIAAESYERFPEAVLKKLVQEIASNEP